MHSLAGEAVAKGSQAQNKLRSVISAKAEIHCSWWIPTFVGMTIVAHFDSYTLLRHPPERGNEEIWSIC